MSSDDLRNALDSLEHRLQREFRTQLQPMKETLQDVKREVQRTNGRVTHLEAHRIATDAAEQARKEATTEAAALVAEKAEEAIHARERSHAWWFTVIGLSFTAITVGTPLVGAALRATFLN